MRELSAAIIRLEESLDTVPDEPWAGWLSSREPRKLTSAQKAEAMRRLRLLTRPAFRLEDVAERAGISYSLMSKISTGERPPNQAVYRAIQEMTRELLSDGILD